MRKISLIIILFLLFLGAVRHTSAAASPITYYYWTANFQSSSSIDSSRSTTLWQSGYVTLAKDGNNYINSGILRTANVNVNQDILSLTVTISADLPSGTSIIPHIGFGSNNTEYAINFGSPYYPTTEETGFHLTLFLATSDASVSPKIYKIYVNTELQDRSTSGPFNRDKKRVADLKTMVNVLNRYYKDFSKYPIVNVESGDKTSQWNSLKSVLDSATNTYNKGYNYGFVSQATGVDSDYQYGYLTDSAGFNYLLWVRLEETGSAQFKDSWLGTAFDINCAEPFFCLSSLTSASAGQTTPPSQNQNNLFIRHFAEPPNIVSILTPEELQAQGISFIKTSDSPSVWFQIKNKIILIRTPEIFQALGGLWPSIIQVSNLNSKKLVKFIKEPTNSTVYLISPTGFKRPMFDMTDLGFYGSAKEIVSVNEQTIDALPDAYLIRAQGDDKVYLIDQNIKRWITSPAVMEKLDLSFDDVVEVDPRELNYYEEGNPMF